MYYVQIFDGLNKSTCTENVWKCRKKSYALSQRKVTRC